MPSAAFAGGLLHGYYDAISKERDRRDRNMLFAAQALMQSGRVRNFEEILPLLGDTLQPLGAQARGGKSGKGKGGMDANSILARLINPALQMQQQGGQSLLLSDEEVLQRQRQGLEQEADVRAREKEREFQTVTLPLEKQREAGRLEEAKVRASASEFGHSPTGALVQAAIDADRATTEANGEEYTLADRRASIQKAMEEAKKAGQKVTGLDAAVQQKEQEFKAAGKPFTYTDRLNVRKQWYEAGGGLSQEQKLRKAQMDATFRYYLGAPTAEGTAQNAQYVTIDGEPRGYINLGDYTGKEKNLAGDAARRAGLTALLPKEAERVQEAQAARSDIAARLAQVEPSLPVDWRHRPVQAIKNYILNETQESTALASLNTWRLTAFGIVRAMGVSGRIPVQEFNRALEALGTPYDTLDVAIQKAKIADGILEQGMKQTLLRGGEAKALATPSGGGARTSEAPKTPNTAVRNKARQFLISQGKQADEATIDTFLKNNPTFK